MATTLWASAGDRRRIEEARSAVLLVGSYDGSGNFGDLLQLATAIETVAGLPGEPLPIAVVERETHGHHVRLRERYPTRLGGAAFVHYHEGRPAGEDDLLELQWSSAPTRSALYLYGGGYLNAWWASRKVAHAAVAERLAAADQLPVVASGLQVEAGAIAPGGVAHELLSRASWIGVRDVLSLESVRSHIEAPAELSGDDAVPSLHSAATPAHEPVVNVHLNPGAWVSEDTDSLAGRVAGLLRGLAEASPERLELQPVIAYEDPRVSERRAVAALLEQHGGALEGAGLDALPPVDLLEDATANELRRFRRARLTIACSYHVTLTSLLTGIPAVLLADNEYYEQKAAGLRDLFRLEEGLLGRDGVSGDALPLPAAAFDGGPRRELLAHLRSESHRVAARFERGRRTVAARLDGALRRSRLRRALTRLRPA